ncbi:MAG: cytochrome c [Pyrinomonadaceae bacterium]
MISLTGLATIVIAFVVTVAGLFYGSQISSSASAAGGGLQNNSDARALFTKHCAICHDSVGRAKTSKGRRTHTRNLTAPEWQDSVSDERIFNSINNGRGSNMPGFNKKLSDTQIDALVSYARQFKR